MFERIHVRKHEVGLRFRRGDFVGLFGPGEHWSLGRMFGVNETVDVVDRFQGKFEHKQLDALLDESSIAEQVIDVDLKDHERAIVWKDGRVGWILGPGRHAFWKAPREIAVERFDVSAFRFEHPQIERLLELPVASRFFEGVRVEAGETVLLFRDGRLFDRLGPGVHVFWRNAGQVIRKVVDLREQVADVTGQEIMTADRLTLRVNLVVTFRVSDPERAVTAVTDHEQALHREAQLVLRESVGVRTLDKLLADKHAVGDEIREALASRVGEFGLTLRGVGLRDIILPGEMKVILNEVILAQKQAEANLIRRREETAAARSQVNTAKLLDEHPQLVRMKELEALQDILAGADATFIVGQGEILPQIRGLISDRRGS